MLFTQEYQGSQNYLLELFISTIQFYMMRNYKHIGILLS